MARKEAPALGRIVPEEEPAGVGTGIADWRWLIHGPKACLRDTTALTGLGKRATTTLRCTCSPKLPVRELFLLGVLHFAPVVVVLAPGCYSGRSLATTDAPLYFWARFVDFILFAAAPRNWHPRILCHSPSDGDLHLLYSSLDILVFPCFGEERMNLG